MGGHLVTPKWNWAVTKTNLIKMSMAVAKYGLILNAFLNLRYQAITKHQICSYDILSKGFWEQTDLSSECSLVS